MDLSSLIEKSAVRSSFELSRAFSESMRPSPFLEIGRSIAEFAERQRTISSKLTGIATEHARHLAHVPGDWLRNCDSVNPLGELQKRMTNGVSDLIRKLEPPHLPLEPFRYAATQSALEWQATFALHASKFNETIASATSPFVKLAASRPPQFNGVTFSADFFSGIERWHRAFAGIAETLGNFPTDEEFVPLHDFLLTRSWYLSLDIPPSLALELLGLLNAGDTAGIEAVLAENARQSLDDIELALIAQYPHRQQIFEDAFEAHREGRYTLSIPALLCQVDGISHELWEAPFFCASKSTPRIQERLGKRDHGNALDTWLRPLVARGNVRENTKRLPAQDATFNRHVVIHGLKCDYATEVNSLKCVALLEFIRSISFVFESYDAE